MRGRRATTSTGSTTRGSTSCASSATPCASSGCIRSCVDPLGIPPELEDRLIDASSPAVEANDLLFAVDLLITDYSSIVFEYSTLGRPMLFYAYDLDEYVGSRDFYEPYETFVPGRIVRTFDELLDAIRRGDYQTREGRAVRPPPLRSPRRRVDRSRHRPDPRPVRRLLLFLRTTAVRAGFALGSLRRPAPRVVLATNHLSRLTGNLAFIADDLVDRHPDVAVVRLASRPPSGLLGRVRALLFAVRAGYQLASARAFVIDDYFFPMYVVRPRTGTMRLQVWHAAGAFKRFGLSVLDRGFGADEDYARRVRIHTNYSLALVSSMSVAPHYAEAFGQPLTLFTSRFGIPRTDLFLDEHRRAAALDRVRRRHGLPDGRRVVLYAPTFRGSAVGAARDDGLLDLGVMHRVLGDGTVVLLRLHPFVAGRVSIPPELDAFAIDASSDPDINELMLVSDVLVTDYSSAIYEYALLGRPILFLAPDDAAYRDERGFYLDFPADLPGPVHVTTESLAKAIAAGAFDLERVRQFAGSSFDVADGHATERLVDEVILPALETTAERDG